MLWMVLYNYLRIGTTSSKRCCFFSIGTFVLAHNQ